MTEVEKCELLPCPFCGSGVSLSEEEEEDNSRSPRPHRLYVIECDVCDHRMKEMSSSWWSGSRPPPETEEDHISRAALTRRWNRRHGVKAWAVLDMSGEAFHSIHETEEEATQAAKFLGTAVPVTYDSPKQRTNE